MTGPPVIKKNPEEFLYILALVAYRYTRERPISETDQYQDGYFALHAACRTWQGDIPFELFTYRMINNWIGRRSRRERRRSKAIRLGEYAGSAVFSQQNEGIRRVDARDELELVRSTFEKLSEKQLRRIALRVIWEEDCPTIAAAESPPTSKQTVHHSVRTSLQMLRSAMAARRLKHHCRRRHAPVFPSAV